MVSSDEELCLPLKSQIRCPSIPSTGHLVSNLSNVQRSTSTTCLQPSRSSRQRVASTTCLQPSKTSRRHMHGQFDHTRPINLLAHHYSQQSFAILCNHRNTKDRHAHTCKDVVAQFTPMYIPTIDRWRLQNPC